MDNLHCLQGRFTELATINDKYMALAYTVRDRLMERMIRTGQTYFTGRSRGIGYLSAEFMIGPQLGLNLINLGMYDETRQAMADLGIHLEELLDHEAEPGLGNGGLGRLAACYLDSLATLEMPAIGYGIRYEFGIFSQKIHDGWQQERTDKWLMLGFPWEVARPEIVFRVNFGGKTESFQDEQGRYRVKWIPDNVVRGMAFDTPVIGYRVNTVNMLRLWKAEAVESFNFEAFNVGDYYRAVLEKITSENITKVLYPNDENMSGKLLRLSQQYFFTSCSIQDMVRIHFQTYKSVDRFHEHFTIQMNDTHPAIAVPELMRILIDEYLVPWEQAWDITQKSLGYTNHTLLPEALEHWPMSVFEKLLPRHLQIILEINSRFLEIVGQKFPGDTAKMRNLSLVDETGHRRIRMAHLASLGSHSVNGVARLHSNLLTETVLHDFYEMFPERFNNKTNGISPRRFLLLSNPDLAALISSVIGERWINNLDELKKLEQYASDPGFQEKWRRVKLRNKEILAELTRQRTGVDIDAHTLFDVQAKRIHEYKRQHLNALNIITTYLRIKNKTFTGIPRTFLFAGKAAPGYMMAKLIIKLINSLAEIINNDPDCKDRLRVVFFPDFNVKNAQRIYPAADISEQISTAGKEASGTGNMKMSLNGALTIGTYDGANIEIREEVGEDNFFLFGQRAEQIQQTRAAGYHPRHYYESDAELKAALDALHGGLFSPGQPDLFHPLADDMINHDEFMVLADYQDYVSCQSRVDELWKDPSAWTKKSILNVARMGRFSSDRAIREYCDDVWMLKPVPIELSLA